MTKTTDEKAEQSQAALDLILDITPEEIEAAAEAARKAAEILNPEAVAKTPEEIEQEETNAQILAKIAQEEADRQRLIAEAARKVAEEPGQEKQVIGPSDVGKLTDTLADIGVDARQVVVLLNGDVAEVEALQDVIADLGTEPEDILELDSLLNTPLAILDAELRDGEYGEFLFITFRDQQGRLLAFTTGGVIIMRKLQAIKAANRFPVLATITQNDKYYDIH